MNAIAHHGQPRQAEPTDLPARMATILVVDDTPANLGLMASLLHTDYRVKLANSGERALEIARQEAPDLVLLDVMMPGMDGYEVCRRLRQEPTTSQVPIIFVTAMNQPEDEARGLACGAVDFIHKPISPPIVRARVHTHLQLKAWQDHLRNRGDDLEAELRRRLDEVERLRDTTMFVMISLAEFRDEDTGNHVKRTQEYVRVLAQHLASQPDTPAALRLDPTSIDLLAKSAPLHDIGKVAIPDHILLKPGPLTPQEFTEMKQHTLHGWEMLRRAAQRLGGNDDQGFLYFAMQIARHHHERWDGSGYPDGLAGEAIPLAARLMAVADVYDALISRRPYKEPQSHEMAVEHLVAASGCHFDPRLVDAMLAVQTQFRAIAATWKD